MAQSEAEENAIWEALSPWSNFEPVPGMFFPEAFTHILEASHVTS
jgi:hypothetical protein